MVSSGERKDGLIFGMRKYNISDRTMKVKEQAPLRRRSPYGERCSFKTKDTLYLYR